MIRINLLPVREARRRADLQQQVVLLVLLLLVTFAGIGFFHFSVQGDIDAVTARVTATNAQIKKYDAQLKQVDEYKKKKQKVQEKLDVIHDLDRSRSGPVRVLDELASRTPDRLWIRRLSAENDALALEGMSLDNEVVALFLTALSDSPYFKNVELEKTELQSKAGLKLHQFSVRAAVTDPEREKRNAEGSEKKGNDRAKKKKRRSADAGRAAGIAVGR